MTDTLHFVAENFEAVATRVGAGGDDDNCWIVTAAGREPHTLRLWWDCPNSETQVLVGTWRQLRRHPNTTPVPEALALAISLVYSVPGVRQK
jgi:hypothetical protein